MSCYDLRNDKFLDFTGCGEHKTHYRDMVFIGNNTWLWGDEGCRRVEYNDGRITSESFTKENKRVASLASTSRARRSATTCSRRTCQATSIARTAPQN